MLGPDWPNNGEIDIVEGVNDQNYNIMTLHSSTGPVLGANSDSFAGDLGTLNCDVNAPNQAKNAGCSIHDASDLSFGTGFNTAGGGVFATEWTSSFIKIWFFPRGSIPQTLRAATHNPTPIGAPPAPSSKATLTSTTTSRVYNSSSTPRSAASGQARPGTPPVPANPLRPPVKNT